MLIERVDFLVAMSLGDGFGFPPIPVDHIHHDCMLLADNEVVYYQSAEESVGGLVTMKQRFKDRFGEIPVDAEFRCDAITYHRPPRDEDGTKLLELKRRANFDRYSQIIGREVSLA